MSEPIIDDVFQSDAKSILVEADKGKRLLNFLIDAAAISLLQTVLVNIFATLASISFPAVFESYKVIFGFNLFVTPFYYLLAEHLFNGKTLGKLVTNTRVVTIDGEKPTFIQLLQRSLARTIPFEPFSYFGDKTTGWHDRLSQTIVIDEEKSDLSKPEDELV